MTNLLSSAYDAVKPAKKQPFTVVAVTDALISDPLNVDINRVRNTPQTVLLTKEDDFSDIVKAIRSRFDVCVSCQDNMIIFKRNEQSVQI